MVASEQTRRRYFSPTIIRAKVRIAEFDFRKRIILKVLIVQELKIFDLLVLTLKFQIYENICDDHHISALCSLDVGPLQFNQHALALISMQLHGRERWGMSFAHFFPRKNAFPTSCNASP